MHKVFRIRTHSSEDAEHSLDEKRRLRQLPIGKMREIVKVPDVIALEFESSAVVAHFLQPPLDLSERVRQDEILGHFQVRLLPVVLKETDFRGGTRDIEIEGTHVH